MGNETALSKQTAGIAGKAVKTTFTQRISNNSCNIHVTPAPNNALGTVTYYYDPAKVGSTVPWLSRYFDFLRRHEGCRHAVPDYYQNYGYKYIKRFTDELYPKLSDQGKKWLIESRFLLQKYMEMGFIKNESSLQVVTECKKNRSFSLTTSTSAYESLELNNDTFLDFAYTTHPPAYIDGGLGDLPCEDLIKIGLTPDLNDSVFSSKGLIQIIIITIYLALHRNVVIFASDCLCALARMAGLAVVNTVTDVAKRAYNKIMGWFS